MQPYKRNSDVETHPDGIPEMMRISEAGPYIGLGKKGIYHLIAFGILPGFAGTGHFRVSRTFLDAVLIPALDKETSNYSSRLDWLEEKLAEWEAMRSRGHGS